MQTRREYAASLGLAKAGARGKFSNAAKEAIAKAEADGMTFSDAAPNRPAPEPAGQNEPKPEAKADPRDTPYLTADEYRFPESVYRAVRFDNGKRVAVSLRECCSPCGVSLVNHACASPVIHGNVAVTIERR